MCGITGVAFDPCFGEDVESMTHSLSHRGPDSFGIWKHESQGLALGHRRLKVIDLSDQSHQPMHSHSERYVMVYNGEIFNFPALRKKLSETFGVKFRSTGDTEVILAAIENFGFSKTLEALDGQFAFAVWDKKERILRLAVDRFGEKPLYYGYVGKAFLFGSELKAMTRYRDFQARVCQDAIRIFLGKSYIPAPLTIYEGIFKAEPGQWLEVQGDKPLRKFRYWRCSQALTSTPVKKITVEAEAVASLKEVLKKSVRERMISDVPLGSFLSGGIDSSLITAIMQSLSSKPVKTYTIGFESQEYDEAPFAREVARHLRTDHHEEYFTAAHITSLVPGLPVIYDEPFADSSQLPTILVSRVARKSVTVCLSGDGGDEVFGGYNRHIHGEKIFGRLSRLPAYAAKTATAMIYSRSETDWQHLYDFLKPWLPRRVRLTHAGKKLYKLAGSLSHMERPDLFYESLTRVFQEPENLLLNPGSKAPDEPPELPEGLSPSELMMLLDTMNYLPGDILCKVDRASMSTHLETRIPFLGREVFELAWALPIHLKIRKGTGKYILRQILSEYVPDRLLERPKTGFSIPLGDFLREGLREWASEFLSESVIKTQNILNYRVISDIWADHCQGRQDNTSILWNILMLQSWFHHHHPGFLR